MLGGHVKEPGERVQGRVGMAVSSPDCLPKGHRVAYASLTCRLSQSLEAKSGLCGIFTLSLLGALQGQLRVTHRNLGTFSSLFYFGLQLRNLK